MSVSPSSRTLESPVGVLRVTARGGALTRLTWCNDRGDDTPGEVALLARAVAQLEAYFAGDLAVFDLPLAPAGLPFQRRVWAEMARIPFGRTRTYGELARCVANVAQEGVAQEGVAQEGVAQEGVAQGGAAQAVGQACGANPIPIIIPCHRVVAGGGRLGGFSGGRGVVSKRALLAHETAVPEGADLFAPRETEKENFSDA